MVKLKCIITALMCDISILKKLFVCSLHLFYTSKDLAKHISQKLFFSKISSLVEFEINLIITSVETFFVAGISIWENSAYNLPIVYVNGVR